MLTHRREQEAVLINLQLVKFEQSEVTAAPLAKPRQTSGASVKFERREWHRWRSRGKQAAQVSSLSGASVTAGEAEVIERRKCQV